MNQGAHCGIINTLFFFLKKIASGSQEVKVE